jgi:hypothetical protein
MHGTAAEPGGCLLRGTISPWLSRVNQRSIRPQEEQAFKRECRHKEYIRSPPPAELRHARAGAFFLVRWITSPRFHLDAGLPLD